MDNPTKLDLLRELIEISNEQVRREFQFAEEMSKLIVSPVEPVEQTQGVTTRFRRSISDGIFRSNKRGK